MRWLSPFVFFIILSGCSFAPTYERPSMPIPVTYKETGKWISAKPSSAVLDRGPWWDMYGDPVLNGLQDQVVSANQNLKAAMARLDQARAVVAVQRSAYFPSVIGLFNSFRQRVSSNTAAIRPVSVLNDNLLLANVTYEVDLWGRIRNSVAAATSLMRASAADVAAIDLSIRAELASDYFALRGDDESLRVLDETVSVYEKALYLTRQRYKGGVVPIADVDQAQNQLYTAKTLAAQTRLNRAQLEHAIAVLIGKLPAAFSLKPSRLHAKWVTIAPQLPSTLIERRPDIAEAELKVQAANSNIGVARAAFFPILNLAGGIGFESSALSNLLSRPSVVWALGPTSASALFNNSNKPLVTETIFDGGRLIALTHEACAQYFETVANYRQIVLSAFKEVEDSLVALRQLDQENHTQTIATTAANRAVAQAMYRYKEGLTTYLDVVVIQNIALQAQLSTIDIRTRRHLASIQLIKALGGGFKECSLSCLS